MTQPPTVTAVQCCVKRLPSRRDSNVEGDFPSTAFQNGSQGKHGMRMVLCCCGKEHCEAIPRRDDSGVDPAPPAPPAASEPPAKATSASTPVSWTLKSLHLSAVLSTRGTVEYPFILGQQLFLLLGGWRVSRVRGEPDPPFFNLGYSSGHSF